MYVLEVPMLMPKIVRDNYYLYFPTVRYYGGAGGAKKLTAKAMFLLLGFFSIPKIDVPLILPEVRGSSSSTKKNVHDDRSLLVKKIEWK